MADDFFNTGMGEDLPPTSDEKTSALLAHVLVFVGGFIAPLIIYLVKKDESKFVRKHAAESLNYQITLFIVMVAVMIFFFFTMFSSIASGERPGVGFFGGFFIMWLFIMVISIANLVFIILGTVKASNGQPFQYPVRIPFVK